MVPLVVVVMGMIMNVDVVFIIVVDVVMTVSQSRCTLLVQCLYWICDTWFKSWPRDYVLLQSFLAHIGIVPYKLLMGTSLGFVLDFHLPYCYVALLHNLCRLQSTVFSLPVWVMASPIFCGVLKQCRFYKVGLIALHPIPHNSGWRVASSSGFSLPTCLVWESLLPV
jgi:hypothetical protein